MDRAQEMHANHSTFRSAYEIGFERKGIGVNYSADGVSPWLKRLRADGVERLWVLLTPCTQDIKATDEAWGILSDGDRGLELWRPNWRRRPTHPNDVTPHLVVYTCERYNRWNLTPPLSVAAAEVKLLTEMEAAVKVLTDRGTRQLAGPLARCIELHQGRNTDFVGVPDLCPPNFPERLRVLSATSLRLMLVLSSEAWSRILVDGPDVRAHSAMLWAGSMFSLEAMAYACGYQEELAA